MDKKLTAHYCNVCFKTHEEENWRWQEMPKKESRGKKRRTRYYCHHGIVCTGCQKLHYNNTYRERVTSTGRYCGLWFGTKPNFKQKIANMSPEEVLSGGLYGLPNQFGTQSEDYTPEVRQRDRETVKELLK